MSHPVGCPVERVSAEAIVAGERGSEGKEFAQRQVNGCVYAKSWIAVAGCAAKSDAVAVSLTQNTGEPGLRTAQSFQRSTGVSPG